MCLFTSESLISQQLSFRHLSIDNGLSQNAVFSILQDSHGFMWFGTKDGLNRYDGRNFVVFQHNPFDTTTISDAFVMKLFEDSNDRIWTGSLSGEINVFHRETESFQRIPLINEIGEKITSNEITDIIEGPEGNMWVGTKGDGLIKIFFNENNKNLYTYKHYLNDPSNDRSLSSNTVSNLLVDEKKTLWIGTGLGLSITNDIVKAHGGSMVVQSRQGKTVFTIKLNG